MSNERFQKACQSAIQSNDKESFPHVFAMCGPGSGKSRICDESLKDPAYNTNDTFRDLINRNSIAVVISFNGSTTAAGDIGVSIQARVGARLLSSYFTGVGNMNQIIELERKFYNLSIAGALTAILVFHEQMNLISPAHGAKFRGVVHVVVDGIGSLADESLEWQSPLRVMLDIFGMLLMSGVNGYFVTNLTTGSISRDVREALRTSHPYVNLRLPLLREIDCQKICTRMLGDRKWRALREQGQLKLLFLLSEIAIPRYVVMTLAHLSETNLEVNLQETLLTRRAFVINEIIARFKFPKNSILKSTLSLCIETCIVNTSCAVKPEMIDLVNSGWLYLEPKSSTITSRISIPPVVLYALENLASDEFLMKPDVRYFAKMLRGIKPDWKFFQEIIAAHEAAKASIYRQMSSSISLEKYCYSGAIVGVDVRNIILKFNNNEHPVLKSKHRFPETEKELQVYDN